MVTVLTLQCPNLGINNEKLGLIGGMQANMIGDSGMKALLNTALLKHDMLQIGVQLAHISLHDFNQQCLLIGVMIINTSRLDTSNARNISEWCSVITILGKKLHSGSQNFFSH